jgi:hypothetical protein
MHSYACERWTPEEICALAKISFVGADVVQVYILQEYIFNITHANFTRTPSLQYTIKQFQGPFGRASPG